MIHRSLWIVAAACLYGCSGNAGDAETPTCSTNMSDGACIETSNGTTSFCSVSDHTTGCIQECPGSGTTVSDTSDACIETGNGTTSTCWWGANGTATECCARIGTGTDTTCSTSGTTTT